MNGDQNQVGQPAGLRPERDSQDAGVDTDTTQQSVGQSESSAATVPSLAPVADAPAGGFFRDEDAEARAASRPVDSNVSLEWTASDVAVSPKPAKWTAMILGGSVVVAALVYLLNRDAFSAGAIVGAALLFVVFSSHKPHALNYRLDAGGIRIGQKYYPYHQFRSFSVDDDEVVHNITLMPLKRFMPILTLNYTPDVEAQIIEILADRLPMDVHRRDAMDAVIKKLRF